MTLFIFFFFFLFSDSIEYHIGKRSCFDPGFRSEHSLVSGLGLGFGPGYSDLDSRVVVKRNYYYFYGYNITNNGT